MRRYLAGQPVVDVGCGEGVLTETAIAPYARNVLAIDLSSTAIDRAKRASHASNVTYVVGDVANFDFEAAVTGVILLECLYYLPSETQASVLRKIRALSSAERDRHLIVSTPITGGKYFSREDLSNLLVVHGFEPVGEFTLSLSIPARGLWRLGLRAAYLLVGRGMIPVGVLHLVPQRFVYQQLFVARF